MDAPERTTYYVTTPIYYVTAKPHLGSLYSTLIADVLARWHAMRGMKVFFLTGTDEHGQKIAQAAQAAGKDPKSFVDSFIESYKNAWRDYHIDYTFFMRTTDEYHVKAVQSWLEELLKSGDIYKSFYRGWYCTQCETFVTAKEAHGEQKPTDQPPACPTCGRGTTWVEEETYSFRLSAYQDRLLEWYAQHPDFIIPKERAHEVINFVQSGLKDLSISRTTVKWGIPFPNDSHHVAYVWADALNNYITAIGYKQPGKEQEFATWWPADVQVLGKDIVRFHAVYWPAFLMASKLALPKHLLVHGWIKVNQQKMSKSLGNVIDPIALRDAYGADPVRYYLMRYIAVTHDSDFSTGDLERAIASDLANDLGNLLNRVAGLAQKHGLTTIQAPKQWPQECLALQQECRAMIEEVTMHMDACMFHMALAAVWKYINRVNAFVHETQPWKLAATDKELFAAYLSAICHSLRVIGILLWPVMPKKMEELFAALGIKWQPSTTDHVALCVRETWHYTFIIDVRTPLFIKPETMTETNEAKPVTTPEMNYITIDDFAKVELLVGHVIAADTVPKSDKLLKLEVDFGPHGKRQILSGIRTYYSPEAVLGKKYAFVFNLKPRAMLGMESQGMLLAAQREDSTVCAMQVEDTIANGTRLR